MIRVAYHPIYKHPLPLGHRFPMQKYELLHRQLLHEGTCDPEQFFVPGKPNMEAIKAVHDPQYVEDLLAQNIEPRAARKVGFPMSEKLIEREFTIAQGTLEATQFALKDGCALNIAGGTHHAFKASGEAFCLLNDQAIAAKNLIQNAQAKQILIIDLDVHQGNGTAEIFEGDDSVFTFSMHGAHNYPFRKEKSDLDIGLPNDTEDKEYLEILAFHLPRLIDKVQPDFIFYLSGVDILATDKLGKLACSMEGCKTRDRMVLEACHQREIPVQISMGGGYSPDIKIILEAHANTYRLAHELWN
ncbi:histone deacetylase [Gilvibacter sediminis]|uniref:histone deacetylase family protein n=1 Tax=Gilvibacter sediminis TaxID=379071 RepID=UPI0023502963|nr:histone deacetylase [Gilvibacter sediminis]MDC7996598.1 histone deacetylase [Gilvibacter sediminis]